MKLIALPPISYAQAQYLYIDLSWLEDYRPWFSPVAHYLTPQEFVLAFASIPVEEDRDKCYMDLFYEEPTPNFFCSDNDFYNHVNLISEYLISEYYDRLGHLVRSLHLPDSRDYLLVQFVSENTGLIKIV